MESKTVVRPRSHEKCVPPPATATKRHSQSWQWHCRPTATRLFPQNCNRLFVIALLRGTIYSIRHVPDQERPCHVCVSENRGCPPGSGDPARVGPRREVIQATAFVSDLGVHRWDGGDGHTRKVDMTAETRFGSRFFEGSHWALLAPQCPRNSPRDDAVLPRAVCDLEVWPVAVEDGGSVCAIPVQHSAQHSSIHSVAQFFNTFSAQLR